MNLSKKIRSLPEDVLVVIDKAGTVAEEMKTPAYLVGGFVRDILLGRQNLDVDIVVETDGILFADKLAKLLDAHLLKHKRFGTAVLSLPNRLKVDVATARCETYTEPAVLPTVSSGTIYDDLFRRDFSINAMAVALNKHNFGKLVDYFGGRVDLKKKKIRVLHNLSFTDDPTRMLRAIRFEQRYGFSLERKTWYLFCEAKRYHMLDKVSKHRIRDELILALKEARPTKIIKRINKLYGFSFVHRRVTLNKSKQKFLDELGKIIRSFKIQYPKKRALDSWVIFFAALLDGLDLENVKAICFDFAFKKGDTKRILSYFQDYRNVLKQLSVRDIKPSSVYRLLDPLSFEVIALIMAKEKKPAIRKRINEYLLIHNGIRLAVTGRDLKGLGLSPGPHFKKILTDTLHAKIDKIIKDERDEIKFIKEHGNRHIKN